MTRRLYEFVCPENHLTEQFIDETIREADCLTCSKPATRIVSAVACSLDPISGHYPSATMQWAKDRQVKIQQERKHDPEYNP